MTRDGGLRCEWPGTRHDLTPEARAKRRKWGAGRGGARRFFTLSVWDTTPAEARVFALDRGPGRGRRERSALERPLRPRARAWVRTT